MAERNVHLPSACRGRGHLIALVESDQSRNVHAPGGVVLVETLTSGGNSHPTNITATVTPDLTVKILFAVAPGVTATATPSLIKSVGKNVSHTVVGTPSDVIKGVSKNLSHIVTATPTETKKVSHAVGTLTATVTATNTPGYITPQASNLTVTVTPTVPEPSFNAGSGVFSYLWRRIFIGIASRLGL